jgi:hypothetical protein
MGSSRIYNVVARIPGTENTGRKVVICAHLDSHGEGMDNDIAPGADDNATGLAALLEIARNIGPNRLPFDVELIAFNGEENGLLGSISYAASQDPAKVLLAVNLDTLGGNHLYDRLVLCGDERSSKIMEALAALNERSAIMSELEIILKGDSDHTAFQGRGIPAFMISESNNAGEKDHYPGNLYVHTAADTAEKVNFEAVAKSTKLGLLFLDYLRENWKNFVRPSLQIPSGREFQYTATINGDPYLLRIKDRKGLPFGIFYDMEGIPKLSLDLGYFEDFGLIYQVGTIEIIGKLDLLPDKVLNEPVNLSGVEIISTEGIRIGNLTENTRDLFPSDSIPPVFEITNPREGEPIMYFPGRALWIEGITEPWVKGRYFFMGPRNFEAAVDGYFSFNLMVSGSDGSQAFTLRDANGNETSGEVRYTIPRIRNDYGGIYFSFVGAAQALGENPLFIEIAQRLSRIRTASTGIFDLSFFVNPEADYSFDGSAQLGIFLNSRIDLASFPRNLEPMLAAVTIHESLHKVYSSVGEDEAWEAIYEDGKRLGTWDLLDDSVLINYYPIVGHPKDNATEGFASAGMAAIALPQIFKRIIELFEWDECPEAPFDYPNSEALNRVFRIIFYQTPDRTALRNNLTAAWNHIRDNYLDGYEFDNNIV